MATKKRFLGLPLVIMGLVGLALFLAACGGSDDDAAAVSQAADKHQAATVEEEHQQEAAVQEIVIGADNQFRYQPDRIRVKVGQPVRIVFNNTADTLHDWTVDKMPAKDVAVLVSAQHEMGTGGHHGHEEATDDDHVDDSTARMIHVAAEAHAQGVLEFTPTEPGTYVFYCTVPGHRQLGMEGIIVVEEA